MQVEDCPTDMLVADYYSKPLQGKQFQIFRNSILNIDKNAVSDFVSKSFLTTKLEKTKHPNTTEYKKQCGLQECIGQSRQVQEQNTQKVRTYTDACIYNDDINVPVLLIRNKILEDIKV